MLVPRIGHIIILITHLYDSAPKVRERERAHVMRACAPQRKTTAYDRVDRVRMSCSASVCRCRMWAHLRVPTNTHSQQPTTDRAHVAPTVIWSVCFRSSPVRDHSAVSRARVNQSTVTTKAATHYRNKKPTWTLYFHGLFLGAYAHICVSHVCVDFLRVFFFVRGRRLFQIFVK